MFSSLRHRGFRHYCLAQTVSQMGTWMQNMALSWLVYRMTGSGGELGVVVFCTQIPMFALSPLAGVVVDRCATRRLLQATQTLSLVSAGLLAMLTISGHIELWHVKAIALFHGTVSAFDAPARQVLALEMVGREDLPNAIAINSSIFNASRMAGPALGGILVATVGEGWCFALNALSYLGTIVVLSRLVSEHAKAIDRGAGFLGQLRQGVAFVSGSGLARSLFAVVAVTSLTCLPYAALLPLFADRVLETGASGLGGLTGAAGAGALAGALILATRARTYPYATAAAAAGVLAGLALVVFAMSQDLWLSMGALAVVGFCNMVQLGSCNSLLQLHLPVQLRGRVMALYTMTLLGLAPVGALVAGKLSEHYGEAAVLAVGGLLSSAGATLFGLRQRERILDAGSSA